MKQNWKPLLILALIILAAFYLYPTLQFYGMDEAGRESMKRGAPSTYYDLQRRSINLGLDLQGGIHLVMEVDVAGLTEDEARDAVARAQEVIRNRVDQFGVAEPTIQRQGATRIIVELPGLQDVDRAKNLIGQTALLEFQLVEPDQERDRLLQRLSTVLAGRAGSAATRPDSAGADAAVQSAAAGGAADTSSAETPSLFAETEADSQGEDLLQEGEEMAPAEAGPRTLLSLLSRVGGEVAVMQRNLVGVKALLADPAAQELIPANVEFLFTSKPDGTPGNEYYLMYLVRRKPE
ncbi:MAG: hypothetical protein ABIL09_01790, partial [Gemmatimonadota bacterium]